MTIQDRAKRYISHIHAISGTGGHNATYQVAAILRHGFSLSFDEAFPILLDWNQTNASPPWTEAEIIHKLNSINGASSTKPEGHLLGDVDRARKSPAKMTPQKRAPVKPRAKWPEPDTELIIHTLKTEPITAAEFNTISPVDPSTIDDPYAVIDYLFCQGVNGKPKDPYLCLGWEFWQATTRKRSDWQNQLHEIPPQFIVPNPMKALFGTTKEGKESARAKNNVLKRRFIVIECDFTEEKHPEIFRELTAQSLTIPDLCATILIQLAKMAPLVMAVNSGGKSTHGWFPVLNAPRKMQFHFFKKACEMGADPAMANPNQWTRFPLGKRGPTGALQKVEYLNLNPQLLQF